MVQPGIDVVAAFGREGLGALRRAHGDVRFFRATLGLVPPVGGQPTLGHVVHPLASDLDFHPLAGGRHHRGVQRFISVGLGQADPVPQPVGVGLVEVGDHAVGPPDVRFLAAFWRVEDDANGKDVVDLLERHLLGLHFVPNAEHALGAAHDLVVQPGLVQRLPDGHGERVDEPGADRFRFPQPGADHGVILGLLVFQAQVLELGFDVVEAQTVGQRRVHEQRLRGDLLLLVGPHVLQGPHVVQAVGELDQNDAHVVAQGEQHLPEILRLGAGPRLEHAAHFRQPIDDDALLDPEHLLDVVQGHRRVLHRVVQQRTHNAGRAQPHFFRHHTGDRDGVVDVGFPALAPDVFVRLQRDIEGLPDGLALGAFLGIFGRAQQPPIPSKDLLLLRFQIVFHPSKVRQTRP